MRCDERVGGVCNIAFIRTAGRETRASVSRASVETDVRYEICRRARPICHVTPFGKVPSDTWALTLLAFS